MSRNISRINRLLLGLLAAGLSLSAFAQSVQYPTYKVGENVTGSQGPSLSAPTPEPWVVSDGTILTPAGTQIYLGTATRAKAIAVNPNTATHTAAVLQMGADQNVTIFNTQTGAVVQTFYDVANYETDGSTTGITYTPDGLYLLLSEDGYYGESVTSPQVLPNGVTVAKGDNNYLSYVNIAKVDPTTGKLTEYAEVNVPLDATYIPTGLPSPYSFLPLLNSVHCMQTVTFPVINYTMPAPVGTTGSNAIPCGIPYTAAQSYSSLSAYPMGIAVAPPPTGQTASTTAYVVADVNNELAKIDLTQNPPVQVAKVRVGNVPHSVVINATGTYAYVSNEAGRLATANDKLPNSTFQLYSDGTPVVAANPTGATATGTVSVVNLNNFTGTPVTISVGLHPTGMAFWGRYLLVANAYSDSISVIDTTSNTVAKTLPLGLPVQVPGSGTPAFGAGPNSIAVDETNNLAYVALYNANAVAVVNLNEAMDGVGAPYVGLIPVGYAPSSVVLDTTDKVLLVANDKGIGTTGFGVTLNETSSTCGTVAKETLNGRSVAEDTLYYTSYSGGTPKVTCENTLPNLGTASMIPVPITAAELATYTNQVTQNNHWDLTQNITAASGGSPSTKPVAIPAKIGAPSLIKHVFVIIRENRTYDQMLGDVVGGNGDPHLAVFGDGSVAQAANGGAGVTPNAHALVERFPLFDNFYDPSRQSADGHNWILQAIAPYSDDIQSPDWQRNYPSNGGDAMAYQPKGHLFDVAAAAGLKMKIYGEYVEENTFTNPFASPACNPASLLTNLCEPSWTQFYRDSQCFDAKTFGSNPNYALPQPSDCASPGVANETTLAYQNSIGSYSPLPNVMKYAVQNYPQFDLGIPDQYRFDVWYQDFQKDVAAGTVPQLSFMWISSDHTGGAPVAQAMQADNDLALGRFVDAISHSDIWSSSAIFVEEDDAQNGTDHVDGHRSPGYIISPYVKQQVNPDGTGKGVTEDSVFYTQVNMTRTIEQILGLKPMNQNDLVASPMSEIFINNINSPSQLPANNLLAWNHVANEIPLTETSGSVLAQLQKTNPKAAVLAVGWLKKKQEIFAAKQHIPDSEDPDTVRHYNWYEATGFVVPFPGDKSVRPASEFKRKAPIAKADLDD
jgi:YVTN family beta-propeller protein